MIYTQTSIHIQLRWQDGGHFISWAHGIISRNQWIWFLLRQCMCLLSLYESLSNHKDKWYIHRQLRCQIENHLFSMTTVSHLEINGPNSWFTTMLNCLITSMSTFMYCIMFLKGNKNKIEVSSSKVCGFATTLRG